MSDTVKVVLISACGAGMLGMVYLYYRTIVYYYDWDKRQEAEKQKRDKKNPS